jgi:general secretion pathway protein C
MPSWRPTRHECFFKIIKFGKWKMLLDKLEWLKLPYFHFSPAEFEKRAGSFFILAAIAVIAYALVGLFYDFVGIKLLKIRVVKPFADTAAPMSPSGRQPADYYAAISQRNLFGSTDKAVADKKIDATAPLEATDLSMLLEIKGTIVGTGKDGFAVIEEKGKNKQVLYKVGNIVAGAKIIRITRNAVVFQIGDKEKVLKMAETKEGPILPVRPAPIAAAAAGASGQMVLDKNEVSAMIKDMGAMLSQAQIRPYYSAGAPDGFMITNIKPGSVYEKIGLTEGDIIQGTDDRKLVTADDMTALYNSIKSGSSFALKIRRKGQQENLQYVFR